LAVAWDTSSKVNWIDTDSLTRFILSCQDGDDGGIADRPGNMPDVFHTFFGVSGLSLLGWYDRSNSSGKYDRYRPIDPIYALPLDVVERLGLETHVLTPTAAVPEAPLPPPPSSSLS